MQLADAVEAIRRGDIPAVQQYLEANPASVMDRVDGRTLLHVATDWPGHFPNVGQTIKVLAANGADLNAPMEGKNAETPLHWAASSDDLEALDALLDLGADIEAPGSVIDGGAPLSDAVAFRQWNAARRLVERGARATFWQAAALGLTDQLREHLASKPTADEVTNAFWNACNGGQLEAAKALHTRGADANWVGHGGMKPLDAAIRNGNDELVRWLRDQGIVSFK